MTPLIDYSILFSLFTAGAAGSLVLRKHDVLANWWSGFFAVAGSLWGLFVSVPALILNTQAVGTFAVGSLPFFVGSFHIDALASFFVFVISLISLFCSIYGIGYVKHYYRMYSIGALGFFYHLFILGMFGVVTAGNALCFLVAWEIMSVASYFLVVYDRNEPENLKAGFLYLVMTQVGTVFILFSFLLLFSYTGSFDFSVMKGVMAAVPLFIKNIVFVFLLIGLGTKAGIVPLHIWLPGAHPAAPSHVSALMSGVMIKTGIYMMVRLFLDVLQPVPAWWGLVLLCIGAVSALLGVLYALTEHDIKRLLAYHSIENIGIILLGVGSALTFSSLGMPVLAQLGLLAALFHTLNHATFKSLLFLGAGSVIASTHTRNMEEYGGLIRLMPKTAIFFLIGSMAISALPPFNGFFSEWLTFQSLFGGIMMLDFHAKWVFIAAAGSLAFTGGLALACFVKAFGITFLARPRSTEAASAKEVGILPRAGMAGLAALSLLFGIGSGYVTPFIEKVSGGLSAFSGSVSTTFSSGSGLSAGSFGSVSAPVLFVLLASVLLAVLVAVKFGVYRKQTCSVGATWDCGSDLHPRMEITATGFARSIVLIFKGVLKPSVQHEIEYHDDESRYLPKSRSVVLHLRDVYQHYLYAPLHIGITELSLRVRRIQTGNINTYILYIFLALIAALITVL